MLVLDLVVFGLGVAGLVYLTVQQVRRTPDTWVEWDDWLAGWSRWRSVAAGVLVAFGGVRTEHHLGYWFYLVALPVVIGARFVPRWWHNRDVARRAAQMESQ